MHLYSIFHLNLMYSSIPEERRSDVIHKCYFPLLGLIEAGHFVAIEASGLTLELIRAIEPRWIEKFIALLEQGKTEFVGSGYAQIIGPLAPAGLNAKNLELGNRVYGDVLGLEPRIALVNEQAYSAGMVGHYLDAGYAAILMEWDNPSRYHSWDHALRYYPQLALGADGREIPLIWNHSISFQKFQRFVHGEADQAEYLSYVKKHLAAQPDGAFSIYGNDVEIFDFRPGRFMTEAPIGEESEWERIHQLYQMLDGMEGVKLVGPSTVLDMPLSAHSFRSLRLESPEQPIPVKKQEKYNVCRWGVTGNEDLLVNSRCYKLYGNFFAESETKGNCDVKDVLHCFSSDYRTHITEERRCRFKEKFGAGHLAARKNSRITGKSFLHKQIGKCIEIETEHLLSRLNTHKGLAIESLVFKERGATPLIGTLRHGYYEDMALGADFFTGHMVLEPFCKPKRTDLVREKPEVIETENAIVSSITFSCCEGTIHKEIRQYIDSARIEVAWNFEDAALPLGVLRLGHVNLLPEAFERDSLFFATHNGGYDLEHFELSRSRQVEHGRPVSFMVSSAQALGVTEGVVKIGDGKNRLSVRINKEDAAALGMITFMEVGDQWFYRLSFSLQETDDTTKLNEGGDRLVLPARFAVSIGLDREESSGGQ